MSYAGPQLLAGDHVVAGFDCGRPALNGWLVRMAHADQGTGTTRTWVVTEAGRRHVVAFYASCTASVLRSSAPRPFGRGQPDQVPALLLARMGVAGKHQRHGLGTALLKHFVTKAMQVSRSVGVRLLLVHAKDDDARAFYEKYGFVESPIDPLTLMMLLEGSRLRT